MFPCMPYPKNAVYALAQNNGLPSLEGRLGTVGNRVECSQAPRACELQASNAEYTRDSEPPPCPAIAATLLWSKRSGPGQARQSRQARSCPFIRVDHKRSPHEG